MGEWALRRQDLADRASLEVMALQDQLERTVQTLRRVERELEAERKRIGRVRAILNRYARMGDEGAVGALKALGGGE